MASLYRGTFRRKDGAKPEDMGLKGTLFYHRIILGSGAEQTLMVMYFPQKKESLFSDFERAFQNYGFDPVPWEQLLFSISLGGDIRLKGPKFLNRSCYEPHGMEPEFMRCERGLVDALLGIVFNTGANLQEGGERVSVNAVKTLLEFDSEVEFRKSTVLFHAVDKQRDDLYMVIVEGENGKTDLLTHRFHFLPSTRWLSSRYPQEVE
jgi:hypothetical protein